MPTSGPSSAPGTAVLASLLALLLCQAPLPPYWEGVDGVSSAPELWPPPAVPWSTLVLASEDPSSVGVPKSPWLLELADGSLLPGAPTVAQEAKEAWQLPCGLLLPLDSLWIRRLGHQRLPVAREGVEKDWLLLRTSIGGTDRRRGWFLGWDQEGVLFEGPTGERRHPWGKVAGVVPLAEARVLAPTENTVDLVLRGGGHLGAEILGVQEDRIWIGLPWGEKIWLSSRELLAVHPRPAALAWQEIAQVGPNWLAGLPAPAQRDRSVEGRALRVGGREYPTGWGMRAPSSLRLQVESGGVLSFWVGVDDEVRDARRHATLRFVVSWEGKELARSGRLHIGEAARGMEIAIPGAGEIIVRLEALEDPPFAAHGDLLLPQYTPKKTQKTTP